MNCVVNHFNESEDTLFCLTPAASRGADSLVLSGQIVVITLPESILTHQQSKGHMNFV